MPCTQTSLFLCCALAFAASARADLKITVRHTFQEHSTEYTQHIKGGRKRLDYRNAAGHTTKPGGPVTYVYGPRIASITDCDTGRVYELNLDAHEYASYPLPKWPTSDELKALAAKYPRPKEPPKATITIETTNVDTGERKEIFGYTAFGTAGQEKAASRSSRIQPAAVPRSCPMEQPKSSPPSASPR